MGGARSLCTPMDLRRPKARNKGEVPVRFWTIINESEETIFLFSSPPQKCSVCNNNAPSQRVRRLCRRNRSAAETPLKKWNLGKYVQIAILGVVFHLPWCLPHYFPDKLHFIKNFCTDFGPGPLSILRKDWGQDQRWKICILNFIL